MIQQLVLKSSRCLRNRKHRIPDLKTSKRLVTKDHLRAQEISLKENTATPDMLSPDQENSQPLEGLSHQCDTQSSYQLLV